jgi:hypothetical protein
MTSGLDVHGPSMHAPILVTAYCSIDMCVYERVAMIGV